MSDIDTIQICLLLVTLWIGINTTYRSQVALNPFVYLYTCWHEGGKPSWMTDLLHVCRRLAPAVSPQLVQPCLSQAHR